MVLNEFQVILDGVEHFKMIIIVIHDIYEVLCLRFNV